MIFPGFFKKILGKKPSQIYVDRRLALRAGTEQTAALSEYISAGEQHTWQLLISSPKANKAHFSNFLGKFCKQ